MNRRGFLAALGAIGVGVALRAVPVLGESFSVLEAPRIYGGASPAGLTADEVKRAIRQLQALPKPDAYFVAVDAQLAAYYRLDLVKKLLPYLPLFETSPGMVMGPDVTIHWRKFEGLAL